MNITQAEAIASLYEELIKAIDVTKIPCPSYRSGYYFTHDQISSMHLEDGQFKVEWSRYAGCGDYDTGTTYHSLDTFFGY